MTHTHSPETVAAMLFAACEFILADHWEFGPDILPPSTLEWFLAEKARRGPFGRGAEPKSEPNVLRLGCE
jgi:hypothetical protein